MSSALVVHKKITIHPNHYLKPRGIPPQYHRQTALLPTQNGRVLREALSKGLLGHALATHPGEVVVSVLLQARNYLGGFAAFTWRQLPVLALAGGAQGEGEHTEATKKNSLSHSPSYRPPLLGRHYPI